MLSKYEILKLNRKTVKLVAKAFALADSAIMDISNSGFDISTVDISKDAVIGDGYLHFHSEYIDKINNESVTAFAKSLGINKIEIATPERISELLAISEDELKTNNIFVAIQIKQDAHHVVMFWKCD